MRDTSGPSLPVTGRGPFVQRMRQVHDLGGGTGENVDHTRNVILHHHVLSHIQRSSSRSVCRRITPSCEISPSDRVPGDGTTRGVAQTLLPSFGSLLQEDGAAVLVQKDRGETPGVTVGLPEEPYSLLS